MHCHFSGETIFVATFMVVWLIKIHHVSGNERELAANVSNSVASIAVCGRFPSLICISIFHLRVDCKALLRDQGRLYKNKLTFLNIDEVLFRDCDFLKSSHSRFLSMFKSSPRRVRAQLTIITKEIDWVHCQQCIWMIACDTHDVRFMHVV